MTALSDRDNLIRLLRPRGQEHLLRFYDRLVQEQRQRLAEQIQGLDWDEVEAMAILLRKAAASEVAPNAIVPPQVLSATRLASPDCIEAGTRAIRDGRVGVILVAGGQGTRLGFSGPKGCFGIGPVSGSPLFEVHARKILALQQRYGASVPLYVMTSPANTAQTRGFFSSHNWFGLPADCVLFFEQASLPCLSPDGKLMLEAPDRIASSPDGHGGMIQALRRSGCLADMARRGVQSLFYFQVDNPLVDVASPGFIGLHVISGADMSVKLCTKRHADENLGVVALRDGVLTMLEYSELSADIKRATDPDGTLAFNYGSVAIHVFSRGFIEQEAAKPLPLHLAFKKVSFCDEDGQTVTPQKPNAFKFERFIFDVLPHSRNTVLVDFPREEEFSPVKNAEGEDSAVSARRDMSLKFARWLEQAGIAVPRDANGNPAHRIEIDPLYAICPGDLKAKLPSGFRIAGDTLLRK